MLLCLKATPNPPPTSARSTADIAAIAPADRPSSESPPSSSTPSPTTGGFVVLSAVGASEDGASEVRPSEVGASISLELLEGAGAGVAASRSAKYQKDRSGQQKRSQSRWEARVGDTTPIPLRPAVSSLNTLRAYGRELLNSPR